MRWRQKDPVDKHKGVTRIHKKTIQERTTLDVRQVQYSEINARYIQFKLNTTHVEL